MTASTTSFHDLPFDTLLHVMTFAGPCEIMALRKCFKKAYDASNQRIVWTNALKRVIFIFNLFRPSFPFHDMSIRDLEHAATSPYRFSKRVWNSTGTSMEPKAVRMLKTSGHWSMNMLLIPGGRFLITRDNTQLNIWDLGFGATEFQLIASLQLSYGFFPLLVQATPDGLGILVLTDSEEISQTAMQAAKRVYEIYPTSASPKFRLVSEMLWEGASLLAFQSELVVFQSGRNIGVWNFRDSTWITWDSECDFGLSAVISNDKIVFLDGDDTLSVWKIPPLEPYRKDHTPMVRIQPIFRLPIDSQLEYKGSKIRWQPLTITPTSHVALIGKNSLGNTILKRFFLEPLLHTEAKTQPSTIIPGEHSFPNDSIDPSPDLLVVGELSTGDVFIVWSDWRSRIMTMNVSTISATDGIPSKSSSICLWEWSSSCSPECITVCASSGRFCVNDREGIQILDYLSLLPST